MIRVLGVGAAAPRARVPAAAVAEAWGRTGSRGQVAVCPPDEDMLTLAWDAGTTALAAAGVTASQIDAVFWGTSRPPFAEGPSHTFLTAALGCSSHTGGALTSGSTHAGMEALVAGADSVGRGIGERRADHRFRRPPSRTGDRVRVALRCRRRGVGARFQRRDRVARRARDAQPTVSRPLPRRRRGQRARPLRRTVVS